MNQTVFTFTMKIDPARLGELTTTLDVIQKDLLKNNLLRFGDLPMVHFASLNVFPPDPVKDDYPCSGPPLDQRRRVPYLVFESNIDGKLQPYLRTLIAQFTAGISAIVRCCADGPHSGDPKELETYLLERLVKPGAYHIGTPWCVVQRIQDEAALRDVIEEIADDIAVTTKGPIEPVVAHKRIQAAVAAKPQFAWAKKKPRVTWRDRIAPWLPVLCQLPMGIINVALTIFLLPYLRYREMVDCEWKGDVDPRLQEKLGAREDFIAQNHMCNMSDIKPGFGRRTAAKAVLLAASINARLSTKGKLAGIPSIHFAHWSLMDGGRRLLFCSNFDGSWENYLDDFIDKAAKGLTAIWGGTIGFPRARWLILGGATNGPRFKAIARNKQVPSSVWYSAYRNLTVDAIHNNSAIRRDLFSNLDDEAARAWLHRL